ncbi:MAG TPA: GNAT family N-acetyltransferase [Ktedonobacteraceae bacterium]|nr:GNAT family N-acetyltransferase [Ktedonobacteraceae bacterium]
MDEIVQTPGSPDMIAALEANLEEEMMYFGRFLENSEVYNDGEVEGFFTGRNHLNCILRTHLRSSDPTYAAASIQKVMRYFQEKQVSQLGWSLGEDVQPERMGTYLENYGFVKISEENIGMALDVETFRAEEVPVAGLEIAEIEDLADLQLLKRMEIEGFGSTEEMAQNYYEMYANAGFGPGTTWRHLCGRSEGEIVAAASLLFYAGVAGIYGVSTLPGMRRRGIARAMVLHTIHVARHAGYRIVILSPTEMSEGIYRRLGFREYTRIQHYSFSL